MQGLHTPSAPRPTFAARAMRQAGSTRRWAYSARTSSVCAHPGETVHAGGLAGRVMFSPHTNCTQKLHAAGATHWQGSHMV